MKSQTKYYPNPLTNNFKRLKPVDPKFKARELPSLIVTHESVVATMDLVADDAHIMVKIWWGDEGGNTPPTIIDLNRERIIPSNDALPRNTFRLQHQYDENAPSRKIILVQSLSLGSGLSTNNRLVSNWESRVIEIDPIYRFIFYPIILEIDSHFDTGFENDSEFDIDMTIHQNGVTLFDDHWFEVINTDADSYPVLYAVEESRFSKDILYSDAPIHIHLYVKEIDNFLKDLFDVFAAGISEFDTSNMLFPRFHPSDYTGSKDFRVPYDLNDGSLNVLMRTEMRLLVPIDRKDELLVQG